MFTISDDDITKKCKHSITYATVCIKFKLNCKNKLAQPIFLHRIMWVIRPTMLQVFPNHLCFVSFNIYFSSSLSSVYRSVRYKTQMSNMQKSMLESHRSHKASAEDTVMFPAAKQWNGYGTTTNYYKPVFADGKYSTEKSKHIGHVGAVFTLVAFSIISIKLFVLLSKYNIHLTLFLAF